YPNKKHPAIRNLGSYINEYYKPSETYTSWSELISVHHNPNTASPIEQAKALQKYLDNKSISNEIETDEDNNSAIVSFVMSDTKRVPIILEFNIFKYELDEICGTIAIQYTKRYIANDNIQADYAKKDFQKNRNKQIKSFKKLKTPILIITDVDNGKFVEANNENTHNTIEKKEKVIIKKETENNEKPEQNTEKQLDE
ncbi:MAG: hypothetical protein MJ231_07305, partial [bacterium]|nr:hypothetical protein [bacterium]